MKPSFFVIFAALSLFAAGCSTERVADVKSPRSISFSAKIADRTLSRVVDNQWETNDAIGVFMFAASDGPELAPESAKTPLDSNVKHIHAGSGNFRTETPEEALFYPANGSAVDFVAYYPFTNELDGNKYPIDLSNQNQLSKVDLLYSNNARAKANGVPALQFRHVLCRLNLTVTATDPDMDLSGVEVTIEGAASRGTFDLSSGEFDVDNDRTSIPMTTKTAPDGTQSTLSASAIVIPTAATTLSIHFAFGGDEESVLTLGATDFEGGSAHGYDISIDKDAETVVVDGSTIDDWTDVDHGSHTVGGGNDTENGPRETIYEESFETRPPWTSLADWGTVADGVTYSSSNDNVFVVFPDGNHFVSLPAECSFSIAGLPVSGWSGVKFECRVRASDAAPTTGKLQFFNGTDDSGADLTPAGLTIGTDWQTVRLPLPAGRIYIKSTLDVTIFIDDIALSGMKITR